MSRWVRKSFLEPDEKPTLALRARVLTALVAAPAAVFLILWLPEVHFAIAAMILLGVALWEWNELTVRSPAFFLPGLLGILMAAPVVYLHDIGVIPSSLPLLLPLVCVLGCLLWAWQIRVVILGIAFRRSAGLEFLVGAGVVFCAWSGLVWLREYTGHGGMVVLVVVLTVWAADSFAYFVGKAVGHRSLAPGTSPGKTVEGALGGMAGALVVAWSGAHVLLPLEDGQIGPWLFASAAAALISIFGDLSVSRLKRQTGRKDSGRLLPGHGGILDRLDGLLAAMPIFSVLWWWLG